MPVVSHGPLYGVLHVVWGLVQSAVARPRVELKASAVGQESEASEDQPCSNGVFSQLIPEKLVETLAMDLTSLKSSNHSKITNYAKTNNSESLLGWGILNR